MFQKCLDFIKSALIISSSRQYFVSLLLMLSKPLKHPKGRRTGRIQNCHEAIIAGQTASYPCVQHIYFNLFLARRNIKLRIHTEEETGIVFNDFKVGNKPIYPTVQLQILSTECNYVRASGEKFSGQEGSLIFNTGNCVRLCITCLLGVHMYIRQIIYLSEKLIYLGKAFFHLFQFWMKVDINPTSTRIQVSWFFQLKKVLHFCLVWGWVFVWLVYFLFVGVFLFVFSWGR